MTRVAISVSLVAASVLLATATAGATLPVPDPLPAPPPAVYFCPRTDARIAIDGDLSDPAWAATPWSTDFVDIEGDRKPDPTWRTNVKMLWDDRFLYVAARLEEPHVWAYITARDGVIYHDNDFEVFIDPDGDNHLYYELEINALGTEWDLLLAKPYRDGGPAINAWDIEILQTAVKIDGTLNDPSDTDTGWSVEIAFPWAVLAQCAGRPAPPADGDIWRMNFSRVQWQTDVVDKTYLRKAGPKAGELVPENNWVWSPQGLIAMHYPERWGEVMFLAAGQTAAGAASRLAENPEHRSILTGNSLMPIYYAQQNYQHKHAKYASSLEALREHLDGCPVPKDLSLETIPSGDRFTARLDTPLGRFTIDETGRLVRQPLKGHP